MIAFVVDHGLATAQLQFADESQEDLHLRNPLVKGPRPIFLSFFLPEHVKPWLRKEQLENR